MAGPLRLVELAHASNVGRVRSHNEDRSLAEPPLLAVADGMGGAKAGEVAAQIAIDTIAGAPTPDDLRERLVDANRRIRQSAIENPSQLGMGTTVTAALMGDTGASIMHVGDSRAYVLHDGELRQVTDDHSVVAEMVRAGQLAAADAERHPSRNIITRALGADPEVDVDRVDVGLTAGDVLLICSDGLSSLVSLADMQALLAGSADLAAAADGLVVAALDQGGNDNITVVLGRVAESGEQAAAIPATTQLAPPDGSGETERIRIPPPPPAQPKPAARAPVVLEPASLPPRSAVRRIGGLVLVVALLVVAFGAWAGSRSYFVDGDPAGTVRVYHGAPFSVLGVDLFSTWADTQVPAAPVHAAAGGLLGRGVRGQGEAVRRAVDVVWRFGLPTVQELQVPPPPPPPPPKKPKPKKTAPGT